MSDELTDRIVAIQKASGPEGYRVLLAEFMSNWHVVEDLVNMVITLRFKPAAHLRLFNEEFLPEVSFAQRLDVLRAIARAEGIWPAAKPSWNELQRLRLARNRWVHRAPAIPGAADAGTPGAGPPFAAYPSSEPTDLEAFKSDVHAVVAVIGEVARAFRPPS